MQSHFNECILLDTQEVADQAAAMVKVSYTNIQPPILTIDDAIQKKSIIPPDPRARDLLVGNPDRTFSNMFM